MTWSLLKSFTWQEMESVPFYVWQRGKGECLIGDGDCCRGQLCFGSNGWWCGRPWFWFRRYPGRVFYAAAVAQRHHLWPSQPLQLIWHQSGPQSSAKRKTKTMVRRNSWWSNHLKGSRYIFQRKPFQFEFNRVSEIWAVETIVFVLFSGYYFFTCRKGKTSI